MIPECLREPINAAVPPGVTHFGFVLSDELGSLLVTEPDKHPYGVSATFNKTKINAQERPVDALQRCLRDQTGLEPLSIFPIPAVWVTANSTGFYFAGIAHAETPPVSTPRTASPGAVSRRLNAKSQAPRIKNRNAGTWPC